MANHVSAKKRVRQTLKRTERNRHIRTTLRTFIKRTRAAIGGGDASSAKQSLLEAVSRIDRAVTKGVLHRKTASRYIARLSRQVARMVSAG